MNILTQRRPSNKLHQQDNFCGSYGKAAPRAFSGEPPTLKRELRDGALSSLNHLAGKWQIVLECKASTCPFVSKRQCRDYLRTVARETYDSVERIKAGYSVYSPSPPKILDNENRSPLEYLLIIRSSASGHTGQL